MLANAELRNELDGRCMLRFVRGFYVENGSEPTESVASEELFLCSCLEVFSEFGCARCASENETDGERQVLPGT